MEIENLIKVRFRTNMSHLIRKDMMEGKEYLVIPIILMAEGVHNGILYSAEEISKFPEAWDGRPVPIYHPKEGETPISCNDPKTWEKMVVGHLFNCSIGTVSVKGKTLTALKGEVWLDPIKAQEVDSDVLDMLEKNQHMDVSTGAFEEHEETKGVWNGEAYSSIAHNIRPDHLALLPKSDGACSWNDGGGAPRINRALMSFDTIQMSVRNALVTDVGTDNSMYVVAVFKNRVIYEQEMNGRFTLYSRGYSTEKNGAISLKDDRKEVREEVRYVPITNENKGDVNVNKEEIVQALIDNELTKFVAADKDFLMEQDEETLAKLAPVEITIPTVEDLLKANDEKDSPAVVAAKVAFEKANKPVKPQRIEPVINQPVEQTMEEFIASVPPQFRDVLATSVQMHNGQIDTLVAGLIANKRNTFTDAQLRAKGLAELQALTKLAESAPPTYAGRTVGNPAINDSKETPMDTPALFPIKK